MALSAPNFFDEFARMRTPSKPFNPNLDYSRIISQLKESCREFGYLAIAPQNLVAPAELESVIVLPYFNKPVRVFVDPEIIESTGTRAQYEGCANIRLVRDGRKLTPSIKTYRPTRVVLSHMVEGRRVTTTYRDKRPSHSTNISTVALIFHEMQHTRGILIADIARKRFIFQKKTALKLVKDMPELATEIWAYADFESPRVLVRDGDKYVLRILEEFANEKPPALSPDALYADYFGLHTKRDFASTFVPREGELLPIEPSDALVALTAR